MDDFEFVLPEEDPTALRKFEELFGSGLFMGTGGDADSETRRKFFDEVKKKFWELYEKYKSVVLFKKKFIFKTVKIYVHTLKPFFCLVFGKPPVDQ